MLAEWRERSPETLRAVPRRHRPFSPFCRAILRAHLSPGNARFVVSSRFCESNKLYATGGTRPVSNGPPRGGSTPLLYLESQREITLLFLLSAARASRLFDEYTRGDCHRAFRCSGFSTEPRLERKYLDSNTASHGLFISRSDGRTGPNPPRGQDGRMLFPLEPSAVFERRMRFVEAHGTRNTCRSPQNGPIVAKRLNNVKGKRNIRWIVVTRVWKNFRTRDLISRSHG